MELIGIVQGRSWKNKWRTDNCKIPYCSVQYDFFSAMRCSISLELAEEANKVSHSLLSSFKGNANNLMLIQILNIECYFVLLFTVYEYPQYKIFR